LISKNIHQTNSILKFDPTHFHYQSLISSKDMRGENLLHEIIQGSTSRLATPDAPVPADKRVEEAGSALRSLEVDMLHDTEILRFIVPIELFQSAAISIAEFSERQMNGA
jgi:hypothetical protein